MIENGWVGQIWTGGVLGAVPSAVVNVSYILL